MNNSDHKKIIPNRKCFMIHDPHFHTPRRFTSSSMEKKPYSIRKQYNIVEERLAGTKNCCSLARETTFSNNVFVLQIRVTQACGKKSHAHLDYYNLKQETSFSAI